ncbi:L-arabinokinase-like isoform X1 [Papaver somniferum]|uniref:L-arabinokinase-like isoform X1 n=1 Tax=Papaver somniferum TaxID=3469 RepID=UPI000E6FC222|nr:L-arabinokinase-like isoform X1 [Papaver somniferum]
MPSCLYALVGWIDGEESTSNQACFLILLLKFCKQWVHHNVYGLGSDGKDRLVKLVQEMQHSKVFKSENGTLFGAKITGGGSGGSVCILGRNSVYEAANRF